MIKNRYVKYSKISETKFRFLVKCFAHELNATQIAALLNINRSTVNRYLALIRKSISLFLYHEQHFVRQDVEYPSRKDLQAQISVKEGVRGRPLSDNTNLIGVSEYNGAVHTELIHEPLKPIVLAALHGKVKKAHLANSSFWPGYQSIIHVRHKKMISFSPGWEELAEFSGKQAHISTSDFFWALTKERLARLRGVKASLFYLHLAEWEFRYNYRQEDMYKLLLKVIRRYPIASRQ
jgi:hypothetical protein